MSGRAITKDLDMDVEVADILYKNASRQSSVSEEG